MPSGPARFLFASVTLSACAPRATGPVSPVLAPEPTLAISDRPEAARESATTFAELVRVAATREGDGDLASCSFERDALGARAVGVTTPALRPLPPPAAELDAALARDVTVNVLTPFGRYGRASAALTLASFTYAPPTREAFALIVTDQGIALRGTEANVPMRDKLAPSEAVAAASLLMPATLFLSAEASVPTPALLDLLQALETQRIPVALAVNLAPETRLPEPASEGRTGTCPDGLPETDASEGALSAEALAPAVSQLRARAADCLANADPRGAAGGHLSLLMRVGTSGVLTEACIDRDDIGDARLRACILDQARKLRFPAPAPSGSIDFALPLTLVPAFAPAQPLLCASAVRH